MKAAWIAGGLLAVAACSTFSSASSDGSDASAPEGGVDAGGVADGGSPGCTDGTVLTLASFSTLDPGATIDGGTLIATVSGDAGAQRFARADYRGGPATAFTLDYDFEVGGVNGVYVEMGCELILYHADTTEPQTVAYFKQNGFDRTLNFAVDPVPTDAGPPGPSFEFETLPSGMPIVKHTHLDLVSQDGGLHGSISWGASDRRTIDYSPDPPAKHIEVLCGIGYAGFSDGGTYTLKISSFKGYACP